MKNILWFNEVSIKDVPMVGGKNASLGEMYTNLTSKGVAVPYGFATTAEAYFNFLAVTGLDKKIDEVLKDLDILKKTKILTIKTDEELAIAQKICK